jgi:hypothetical protein
MLYPGGAGVAGLLVGVLTHAIVVDAARSAEKSRLQAEADAVLEPYHEQLADFRYPALLQQALRRLDASGAHRLLAAQEPAPGWVLAIQPVFSMTKDRRALVLDNAIALFAPGETATPAYGVTVRVVSAPRPVAAEEDAWSRPAAEGSAIQEESAQLVAHSLRLVLRDMLRPAPDDKGFRTLRFALGGDEKVERAQVVETSCQRLVLRNLRGWLLSVPAAASAGVEAGCEPAPEGWR